MPEGSAPVSASCDHPRPGSRVSLVVTPGGDIPYEQDDHPVVSADGKWAAEAIFGNAATVAGHGFTLLVRSTDGQVTTRRVVRR